MPVKTVYLTATTYSRASYWTDIFMFVFLPFVLALSIAVCREIVQLFYSAHLCADGCTLKKSSRDYILKRHISLFRLTHVFHEEVLYHSGAALASVYALYVTIAV